MNKSGKRSTKNRTIYYACPFIVVKFKIMPCIIFSGKKILLKYSQCRVISVLMNTSGLEFSCPFWLIREQSHRVSISGAQMAN